MTLQIDSISSGATEQLAERIGKQLRGGEVIELVSDLGGGKTTFVRGLARGLGSKTTVSSPTFKLSNEYTDGRLPLYHFDFYRLTEAGIMSEELAEVLAQSNTAVVVEWGDVIHDVLPRHRLTITLKTTGETTRQLVFSYPKELEYLINSLR